MSARTRSLFLLHGVVVIFGFTGILGKLISIDAEPLVFWRVTLGGLTTTAFLWFRSRWSSWTWPNVLRVGLVGWVVAAHWVTFFASIKASSVGLALTMLATAPSACSAPSRWSARARRPVRPARHSASDRRRPQPRPRT